MVVTLFFMDRLMGQSMHSIAIQADLHRRHTFMGYLHHETVNISTVHEVMMNDAIISTTLCSVTTALIASDASDSKINSSVSSTNNIPETNDMKK